MAKWLKTEDNEKITYVLDDSSLPAGCTHSGVNRVVIYKQADGVRIDQTLCLHLAGANTPAQCIDVQETGNEIVSG
jgi:hypothetical protein